MSTESYLYLFYNLKCFGVIACGLHKMMGYVRVKLMIKIKMKANFHIKLSKIWIETFRPPPHVCSISVPIWNEQNKWRENTPGKRIGCWWLLRMQQQLSRFVAIVIVMIILYAPLISYYVYKIFPSTCFSHFALFDLFFASFRIFFLSLSFSLSRTIKKHQRSKKYDEKHWLKSARVYLINCMLSMMRTFFYTFSLSVCLALLSLTHRAYFFLLVFCFIPSIRFMYKFIEISRDKKCSYSYIRA